MLRTGRLPAPHRGRSSPASTPGSRPTPGVLLPGTLASPRTGLTPAGCRELVARLRRRSLLSVVLGARATGRTFRENHPDASRGLRRGLQGDQPDTTPRWATRTAAQAGHPQAPAPPATARGWPWSAAYTGRCSPTCSAWPTARQRLAQGKWRRPRQLRCRPPAATTPAAEPDLTALKTRCHPCGAAVSGGMGHESDRNRTPGGLRGWTCVAGRAGPARFNQWDRSTMPSGRCVPRRIVATVR
jgi:hypothetical protein